MEAKKINLLDFELTGFGANGESYNKKDNDEVMIKLYFKQFNKKNIERELQLTQKIYKIGIPTPQPGEYITDGEGRYGIMFQRIKNKKSYARLCGDDPQNVEKYARKFATMCRKLHSIKIKKGYLEDEKQKQLKRLKENLFLSSTEKEFIKKTIINTPEANSPIHGDLHFGNVITTGEKCYFIDNGDFSMGHPYFDLGMVLMTTIFEEEQFLKEQFHMEFDTAKMFWHYFIKEYFGEEQDEKIWIEKLRPYAGVKLLMMEEYSGIKFPNYHKSLLHE